MATNARFVIDPGFKDNLVHWRGSLNPVGDKIKSTADNICSSARARAKAEADEATAIATGLKSKRYSKNGRQKYLTAAALAYSLRLHAKMIYAAQIAQSDENIGIVAAGHAAGAAIEFGGVDNVIRAGDQPLAYSARFILRRSTP